MLPRMRLLLPVPSSLAALGLFRDNTTSGYEESGKSDLEDVSTLFKAEVSDHDIPDLDRRREELKSAYSDRSNTTWRQRLELMWRRDEYGSYSPEADFVLNSSMSGLALGVLVGGYLESRSAIRLFLDKNKHEMFRFPREAQAAMQDRMVMGFIKGGWKFGWRLGLTVLAYTSFTQSMAAIRMYINPLDHVAAGALVGSLWRFSMGPKAMVGAAVAGIIMGLQGGVIMWGLQKISGETLEEKWNREYNFILTKMELKAAKKREQELESDSRKDIEEEKSVEHNPESSSPFTRRVISWTREKLGIFSDNKLLDDADDNDIPIK